MIDRVAFGHRTEGREAEEAKSMAVAYAGSAAGLNSYLTSSVVTLSPGELVLKMYDTALVALLAKDGTRAARVVSGLIDALDFQYRDVALGLFRLYRYCMEEIKRGEYETPARIMRELRDVWAEALDSRVGDPR